MVLVVVCGLSGISGKCLVMCVMMFVDGSILVMF